jgi:hypothetical protein
MREIPMTDSRFYRAVARATGEDPRTIARLGFVTLTRGPVELERQPQTDDGDHAPPATPRRTSRRPRRARSKS